MEAVAAFLLRRGRALAVRRPAEGLLGGLWDLPGDELAAGERPAPGLRRALAERVGMAVTGARRVGSVEHVFSHRRLRLHVFRAEAPPGRVRRRVFDAHRWLPPAELAWLPQSAVTKKALRLVREPAPRAAGRSARA